MSKGNTHNMCVLLVAAYSHIAFKAPYGHTMRRRPARLKGHVRSVLRTTTEKEGALTPPGGHTFLSNQNLFQKQKVGNGVLRHRNTTLFFLICVASPY